MSMFNELDKNEALGLKALKKYGPGGLMGKMNEESYKLQASLNSMPWQFNAMGYADGGMIRGPGAGKIGSIGAKGPTGYADGGSVRPRILGKVEGPGTSTSDSVPAQLSDGEYVIPANVVKAFGAEHFDGLVKQVTGSLPPPPTVKKGVVHATDGGVQHELGYEPTPDGRGRARTPQDVIENKMNAEYQNKWTTANAAREDTIAASSPPVLSQDEKFLVTRGKMLQQNEEANRQQRVADEIQQRNGFKTSVPQYNDVAANSESNYDSKLALEYSQLENERDKTRNNYNLGLGSNSTGDFKARTEQTQVNNQHTQAQARQGLDTQIHTDAQGLAVSRDARDGALMGANLAEQNEVYAQRQEAVKELEADNRKRWRADAASKTPWWRDIGHRLLPKEVNQYSPNVEPYDSKIIKLIGPNARGTFPYAAGGLVKAPRSYSGGGLVTEDPSLEDQMKFLTAEQRAVIAQGNVEGGDAMNERKFAMQLQQQQAAQDMDGRKQAFVESKGMLGAKQQAQAAALAQYKMQMADSMGGRKQDFAEGQGRQRSELAAQKAMAANAMSGRRQGYIEQQGGVNNAMNERRQEFSEGQAMQHAAERAEQNAGARAESERKAAMMAEKLTRDNVDTAYKRIGNFFGGVDPVTHEDKAAAAATRITKAIVGNADLMKSARYNNGLDKLESQDWAAILKADEYAQAMSRNLPNTDTTWGMGGDAPNSQAMSQAYEQAFGQYFDKLKAPALTPLVQPPR